MAVNDAFAACVAGYGWIMRQKCYILDVLHSIQHVVGENIAVAAAANFSQLHDQLQTRATSVWQGIIWGWIQSNTHVQALLPTGRLAKTACGGTTTSFGHESQCRTISKVKNTNRPHSLGEERDSTLGNSLTVIGIFLYQSVWSAFMTSFGCKWRGWLWMDKIAWIFVQQQCDSKVKETGVLSLWRALISKSSGARSAPTPQLDFVNPTKFLRVPPGSARTCIYHSLLLHWTAQLTRSTIFYFFFCREKQNPLHHNNLWADQPTKKRLFIFSFFTLRHLWVWINSGDRRRMINKQVMRPVPKLRTIKLLPSALGFLLNVHLRNNSRREER